MTLAEVREKLRESASPAYAEVAQRFFKTAPGEYGHGDRFLGVRVPALRKLVRECDALTLADLTTLLDSPWHEERVLALLALVRNYAKREDERAAIYKLYLAKTDRVNGWDLVDASAEHILGPHLLDRSRTPLTKLARSHSVWERRMAILATFHFIKRNEFHETLRIAELLLHDDHDLIHKAVGWMLRETGQRDRPVEETFLREHAAEMPRTMLRYALEKFPEPLRKRYLGMKAAKSS
ncbi:MAG TPA: DNA alkylation repair protein [Thermoanaerobaculia bacterium]|nr:DNA alkylation repair protein [Thermoanaerobaculia bacterium]